MARGIKSRQPLCQSEGNIGERRYGNFPFAYRNTNALVNVQMRLARNRGGQAHTQIITPLLDIENGFGHE